MKLPVLKPKVVFHIGTLQADQKGARFTESLEGHCLSVSMCPLDWRSIAQLGGLPLWTLTRPGAVFLDMHKAEEDVQLHALIEAWGIQHRLVEKRTLWRAWQTDEEGEWFFSLHAEEDEARSEVFDDIGPDGDSVEPIETLTGTRALASRVNHEDLSEIDAFSYLALVWAEATQPQLDGVWWDDLYEPESLSAPRGGIFPAKLPLWKTKAIEWSLFCDEDEIDDLKPGLIPIHQ